MNEADAAALCQLRSPQTIRARAQQVLAEARDGRLEHFALDEARLAYVVAQVAEVTRAAYPDLRAIPYHSRFRHFAAGGVDRLAGLHASLATSPVRERLRAQFDLVITSVLLDAGAGMAWSYQEPTTGQVYKRSEGLAVASYHLFIDGGLSFDPARTPHRADADALARIDEACLARAFQVRDDNPLVGLAGRAEMLQRLGSALRAAPEYFGEATTGEGVRRPGVLADYLWAQAEDGRLSAAVILNAVLGAFGSIWPGRETLAGVNLGDVWTHSRLGRIPFHKLSQWLTYSLCEALEQAGLRIVDIDALTGLAEYRNGGLFVDGGVLLPKHDAVTSHVHAVGSDLVIEWRALTLALLDRVAHDLRTSWGLDSTQLPLAKVLEGGTWAAGRRLAAQHRPDGGPPIRVDSDGTVF